MQLNKKRLNGMKMFFVAAVVLVFSFCLIYAPEITANGVRQGLSLCSQVVIPSLFPFMVLSAFMIKSGLCGLIGNFFSPIMKRVFKLPGIASGAIIMGALGGFPIGSKMTAQLYENGEISRNAAQRMMMFCVNAGPAFVIGAIGSTMLKSRQAGMVMFLSLSLSSLIVGVLSRFIAQDGDEIGNPVTVKTKGIQKSVVESVAEGASSILSVCSWIILFSCVCSLISALPESFSGISVFLKSFFEVTSGSASAVKEGVDIALITGIIGWAGVSVHCQVLEYVRQTKMRISVFLALRAVNGALASLISYELFKIIPCATVAFASADVPLTPSHSAYVPACAGLMLMGALLIFDLDKNKEMC
ncbi:MAG TPA: nucleoside recognition domain-containing protein [Clostridia bacterium]|nr:nucleoside recognition domain-containing protein [Clostridia bacterium]